MSPAKTNDVDLTKKYPAKTQQCTTVFRFKIIGNHRRQNVMITTNKSRLIVTSLDSKKKFARMGYFSDAF